VVFSSVCYEIDTSGANPVAGSGLNRIGHAAFLLNVVGLLVGGVTLILFTIDKQAVIDLANGIDHQAAIQGLINGIIAFNGVYFAQLLGLKPK
jgi:predicted cobalt transporter CbtA